MPATLNDLSEYDKKYLTPEEQQQIVNYKNQWETNPDANKLAEEIRARYGYSGGKSGNEYINFGLSDWDKQFLTPEEQQQLINYKLQWGNDPNQQVSYHNLAEQLRSQYGYSGGPSGNQYIPTFNAPKPPTIPDYQSPYADYMKDIFDKLSNPPQYQSPYEDLINQQISAIMNRPQFSYDPDTDPAYQAFMQRALRAGDKAYADNLGGLSAMTGGRPNSWAGTVASQARNQYVAQAQEAVIHFEDRAYSRYKDETQDMYQLVNLLQSQDEVSYSRFRDTIGDTKDLANLVLQLDSNSFEKYKYMSENQWRTFDYEYTAYKDSLQYKKDKIAEAMDRTNMLGYVNNQDAVTLGLPAGTLSQAARERAEQMQDYIKKSQIDLQNEMKKMEKSHEYDLQIIKAKEQSDLRMMKASASMKPSGGGGGGSRRVGGSKGGSKGSSGNVKLKASDGNKKNQLVNSFNKYTRSKEFQRMSDRNKYAYISNYIDTIVRDGTAGAYGANSVWIANEALYNIEKNSAFKKYYHEYELRSMPISGGGGHGKTPTIKRLD